MHTAINKRCHERHGTLSQRERERESAFHDFQRERERESAFHDFWGEVELAPPVLPSLET
jgi:hypothetical protein